MVEYPTGLPQLTALATPAVITAELLLVLFGLADYAQADTRDGGPARLGYFIAALFTSSQAYPSRQMAAGSLYRVLDSRIDLVMDCPVFGETASHSVFLEICCCR